MGILCVHSGHRHFRVTYVTLFTLLSSDWMISTPSLRHQGVPGTNRVYKGDNYVTLFTLLSSDWISTPSLRHQGVPGTNRV